MIFPRDEIQPMQGQIEYWITQKNLENSKKLESSENWNSEIL